PESSIRFHQLNAVAEWISYIHVRVTRQRFSFDHFHTRTTKFAYKFIQISNDETRMSFTCRAKIRIDTQMNLHSITLEPHATPSGEIWRFRNLRNSEQTRVKVTSGILLTGRHSELNVFDSVDVHLSTHHSPNRPLHSSIALPSRG